MSYYSIYFIYFPTQTDSTLVEFVEVNRLLLSNGNYDSFQMLIRSRKSGKDRKYSGQHIKHRWTSNDLQTLDITLSILGHAKPVKYWCEIRYARRIISSYSKSDICNVTLLSSWLISRM
jgi:hypothetical protein